MEIKQYYIRIIFILFSIILTTSFGGCALYSPYDDNEVHENHVKLLFLKKGLNPDDFTWWTGSKMREPVSYAEVKTRWLEYKVNEMHYQPHTFNCFAFGSVWMYMWAGSNKWAGVVFGRFSGRKVNHVVGWYLDESGEIIFIEIMTCKQITQIDELYLLLCN